MKLIPRAREHRSGASPALKKFVFLGSAVGVLLAAGAANAQPQANAPPGTPQPSPYGSMQAGGLSPPPPMPEGVSDAPAGTTEANLEQAKKKDSGRGLEWVWLNTEGGFEIVGLQTFNANTLTLTGGFVPTSSVGGVIGGGAGVRLLFLTLGARARVGFFDAWQLFSLGPEVGIHLPLGAIEPHLDFGFGYTGLGNFSGAVAGVSSAITIRGFDARAGFGVDYYVTPVVSLGLNGSFELLGLTRPGVDPSTLQRLQSSASITQSQATLLAADGSAFGGALALTAVAGLHF